MEYLQKINLERNTSNNPLITIITVVFNGDETIESTINNVIDFKKKYSPVEFIIIDGGSKDETTKIISRYEKEITYWISESDGGIYDAMNKGWLVAKEGYVLYLGSGDKIISFPKNLQLFNAVENIYYGKVFIGDKIYNSGINYRMKLGNMMHHQALLIYRDVNIKEPFDLKYKVYADYNFNAKLFNAKYNFILLNDFESYALPGGTSSKVNIKEILEVIRSNFGLFWAFVACGYHLIQGFKYGFYRYTFK